MNKKKNTEPELDTKKVKEKRTKRTRTNYEILFPANERTLSCGDSAEYVLQYRILLMYSFFCLLPLAFFRVCWFLFGSKIKRKGKPRKQMKTMKYRPTIEISLKLVTALVVQVFFF